MPERITKFFPDGYYHLYNRGVDGRQIFLNESNYLFFTNRLLCYSRQNDITIIAYCLMPTHYHLLVHQNGERPAGLLCQLTCNSYSKAFNLWNHRTGTLFESRYKSISMDQEEYIYQLCIYIHANPVKAGMVGSPEEWKYSNYAEWLNDEGAYDFSELKNRLGSSEKYRSLLQEYLNNSNIPPNLFNRYLFE